jgi:hypothetical protein
MGDRPIRSLVGEDRAAERRPRPDKTEPPLPPRQAWSTFGPHPIGAERFATVSSSASFAQVAEAILGKHARVENPDKTPMAGGRHEG